MSRGISKQQQHILETVEALIDAEPLKKPTHCRGVGTYDIIEALYPAAPVERRWRPGIRSRQRPAALVRGLCTSSQHRSLQRSLKGLVDRGLLVSEKGAWRERGTLAYSTAEEIARWDVATGGPEARAEAWRKLVAKGKRIVGGEA